MSIGRMYGCGQNRDTFNVCAGYICIILAEHAFGADGGAIPLEAFHTAFGNHVWKLVRVNNPFRGRGNDSGLGNADRRS